MTTASRLWQIDARFLQYMQMRSAGLTPDTIDDEFTDMVAEYLGVECEPIDWTDDGIPVVVVSGPLYKRKSPFCSNYRSIGEALDLLLALEIAPPAAVLKIDSPGGMVAGLDAVVKKVAALAERTLVVAVIDGMGCSAAYRIASQAGTIVATPDADVGCIGTFWQWIDSSKAFADAGLKSVVLKTGPYKGLGACGEEITPEQIDFLQHSTDTMNAAFLADVQSGRGFSNEQLAAVSDGRFWSAAEAKDLGLIDQIGTMSDVLAQIRSQKKGSINMAKETLRPASAQASDEAPDVETPNDVDNDDVTPAETPDETPAPTPTEAPASKGLGDYMAAFGDAEGARMFLQGVNWDAAQSQTISALRGQIQDMKAENAQLKGQLAELGKQFAGETKPLSCGETPKRKSFGEACRAGVQKK